MAGEKNCTYSKQMHIKNVLNSWLTKHEETDPPNRENQLHVREHMDV